MIKLFCELLIWVYFWEIIINSIMKIVTILGARPQFIKASSLSREVLKYSNIEEVILHTGQHFDKNMSEVFFDEMEIPKPKYNLEINSLSHGAMTGRMLEEIEKILFIEMPDWVVVYGDTNSTIAGALAAKKLHIKVAHIEAGLRSFDMEMPEEVNRILTDKLSNALFCPTEMAVQNLINEGYDSSKVEMLLSGDIMYDSALYYKSKMIKPKSLNLDSEFILATIHRQENTDNRDKLEQIVNSFNKLNRMGHKIISPLHPRTKMLINEYGLKPEFTIIEPVGYLEMIYLLDNCKIVVTDSGGLQKEAYFFNKFCVTLRDTTEWVELIDNNVNILMSINNNLSSNIIELIETKISNSTELYGNGNSAEYVIKNLVRINKY